MSRSSKRDRKFAQPASCKATMPIRSVALPADLGAVTRPVVTDAGAVQPTLFGTPEIKLTPGELPLPTSCVAEYDSLVQANTSALELLVTEFQELRGMIRESLTGLGGASENVDESNVGNNPEQIDELLWQIRQRDERLTELQRDRDSLQEQNDELASKLAQHSIRNTVKSADSSTNDALSWEERKRLILEQMESDSFDTEAFVAEIQASHSLGKQLTDDVEPIAFLTQLTTELDRRSEELQRKNAEIGELRCLLEQQGGTREGGLAVGAAAIAQLMDSDELVADERERLKQLQAEWEEKFRRGEIAASLERATLSRERQELAKKQSQLEEQLEHMKRELRQSQEMPSSGTGPSRRWFQKLGLSEGNS